MCGIVGYIGHREAKDVLLQGLKRLEYRGYDSAGMALIATGATKLNVYKAVGRVKNLEDLIADKDTSGHVGIAHTRWATHGEPSTVNAHPHTAAGGRIALVHNGIIENYQAIKQRLMTKGLTFESETDTEVLAALIGYLLQRGSSSLAEAVRRALNIAKGAYAIAVLDEASPNEIVVARMSSPLVVGIGEQREEFFIASDATPIVEYTHDVVYLNDGEIATISLGKDIEVIDLAGGATQPDIQSINLDIEKLEKGGFDHYMLKEIFEQPTCLRECMRGRLLRNRNEVVLSAVRDHRERLMNTKRLIIVSCGTSWHAGLIGKQLIENFCSIPVTVEYASEFRYRNPVIEPDDVVIAVSQSGETADTLAAIELARRAGAFVYGIVNVVGSSIARNTDTGTYIHVGPEIGVASTKAFTGQVLVFTLLALALGHAKGTIDIDQYHQVAQELAIIPDKIERLLQTNEQIADLAKRYTYARNFIYLGRGFNYPVALEGALKLKEISYIHAEGYPAAEMKHGPIALIDQDMPVVCLATHHQLYHKMMSNIEEVKSRGGRILAIVTEGDTAVAQLADQIIEVPPTLACLAPLLTAVPLQLLAYHIAVEKGLNVDRPRNLAKSVTVE